MASLRILEVKVVDNSNIDIKFSDSLSTSLITDNVKILSETINVPDSKVLSIKTFDNIISLTCQPLTTLGSYYLTFKSVLNHPFQSKNGDVKLSEDNVSNRYLITGPIPSDNPVNEYLTSFLRDNIYNIEDDTTVVSQYVKSLAVNFSKALYDIRQLKNENYLSSTIFDEEKVRGTGPFDRLNEEAAYEIIRVGRTPTGTNISATLDFSEFPDYPVTLQKASAQSIFESSSQDEDNKFNINSLILNFSKNPITKVSKVTFNQSGATPIYEYDVSKYGYQIKDSSYDKNFAFAYATLKDNQIKLSDEILSDPEFELLNIVNVIVEFEYKNLGKVIDASTLDVYTSMSVAREALPPITKIFSLKHPQILDTNGDIATIAGLKIVDSNSPTTKHPAFLYELPFRLNGLPRTIGQYSIDYATGTVYVFGASISNDGTGPFPPLVSYDYRFTYKNDIDYTYDESLKDLISIPTGSLRNNKAKVKFAFEEVLIPGIDYVGNLHVEQLEERIGNSLVAANVLKTKQTPITNVFRIYNETSGEVYPLSRWFDNKVYFRYTNPPSIVSKEKESVSFQSVNNELLFVNTTLTNASFVKVFKILLNNSKISSASQDCIGSSINSSLSFSDSSIFVSEKWYDILLTEQSRINSLSIGEFIVDYENGIIYCAVSNTQNFNIGTCNYKKTVIELQSPHVISVEDIYNRISPLSEKNKTFEYNSFEDGFVFPNGLNISDESFLNNNIGSPYQLQNNDVGIFFESSFLSGVTNQVKFVRGLFEYDDLKNNTSPINFASVCTSSDFNIKTNSLIGQSFSNVEFDGVDYYVMLDKKVLYLSSNITYTFNVFRFGTNTDLWDLSGSVVVGDQVKLILSGVNSPVIGELVDLRYDFKINSLSRVIVDYSKGDLLIDYTYLADEIIISYEYGDNVLDFRKNENLFQEDTYYVSYKVGALRDSLLKNFGNLINIPELLNFDVQFDRERYRDALMAALSSFIQGPTVAAIKNIGRTISHITPDIVESVFDGWSLGNSLLNPQEIKTSGDFELLSGKFGNGVLVNAPNQTITMASNSNLRLEEGTFETWVIPQWDGLDNDAELTFSITKNGALIESNEVFVGAGEFHPSINNNLFSINKEDAAGTPNKNKDGVFIYYAKDLSGDFSRWYVEVTDGYVFSTGSNHKIKITSTGSFYDTKYLDGYADGYNLFSGTTSINFSVNGPSAFSKGITFLSDVEHYILDTAEDKTKNRISIFKDISGYLNFRVFDKDKNSYSIGADISSWKNGDAHLIAASWKLNSKNERDEMHLFIDGFEVPNIIRYGHKPVHSLHEKFRTVNPEEIIASPTKDIVGSTDLVTNSGSNVVSSTINFSAYNISISDKIYIDEIGFDPNGYSISGISGQTLSLATSMPISITNGNFSVNKTVYPIGSEVDLFPNISVSTLHSVLSGTINTTLNSKIASSLTNFGLNNIEPGHSIKIDGVIYTIVSLPTNTSLELDRVASATGSFDFHIYNNEEEEIPGMRAIRPSYSISKDGYFSNEIILTNNVYANDLVLIRTLGLNNKKYKKQYYVWGTGEYIINTQLPAPVSLNEVSVRKILLTEAINSSTSSVSGNQFTLTHLDIGQLSDALMGRTLCATLSGTNIDFSTPVTIQITGISGFAPVTETISFTDYGTVDFANMYHSISSFILIADAINPNRGLGNVVFKEKYSITRSENNSSVPVIKYSYNMGSGNSLFNDGYGIVRDDTRLFSHLHVGNTLVIHAPISVGGFYKIKAISEDRHSLTIEPTSTGMPLPLVSFTDGQYSIVNVIQDRTGLQNGFFSFEVEMLPSQEYFLINGFYELEYFTYTSIKLDLKSNLFIGSSFESNKQANAIIDQIKIYNTMMTDTRVGETISSSNLSITKDYNSLKPLKKDNYTLALLTFDNYPFVNDASFYTYFTKKDHFQSSVTVNDNFDSSIVIIDKPIKLDNLGLLEPRKEGTVEFWINPTFDTSNDPNRRVYFDAFGAVTEELVSNTNVSVKLNQLASSILSVKLNDKTNIDYFAGGKLEIDTQSTVSETLISTTNNTLSLSKAASQIVSVKIVNDFANVDYFADGSIDIDNKKLFLGKNLPFTNTNVIVLYKPFDIKNKNSQIVRLNKKLPAQNTKVVVTYIPKGMQGDRLSVFKDEFGYMNFAITASNIDYVVRAEVVWNKDTWHRVKASYKTNTTNNKDELRLFLDGYEYSNVQSGTNLLVGDLAFLTGLASPGDGYTSIYNIHFKDPINELFIGNSFDNKAPAYCLLNNVRLSNISRPIYSPYGESLDVNYNKNIAFPVTKDLYTTYLMDSAQELNTANSLATIRNRNTGQFDFSVNIFDSFGIVGSSLKVKEVLEKLIKTLKPANSKTFIKYTI